MLDMTMDELKRVNLVELLSRNRGMSFHEQNGVFRALSPFTEEKSPSFYVSRAADGHWVYCDHSDGGSGSVIDLMMRQLGTDDVRRATDEAPAPAPEAVPPDEPATDWQWLHDRLRMNDASLCRDYLTGRGLDGELVDELIESGTVVLNRLDASRYCCFAIRDAAGRLAALFNRLIDGPAERDKFLLGRQHPFCPRWESLAGAREICLCEGIVDALSLLTLNPQAAVVALPGAHFDLSRLELPPGTRLIDAFDDDEAGRAAGERLRRAFPDRRIRRFDLMGAHDLNDFLRRQAWMSEETRGINRLSVEDKIAIGLSDRPSRELARKYGVHHSRICAVRNEASNILASTWRMRQPGPRPKTAEVDPEELARKDEELREAQKRVDLLTMRKEWLQLQLEMQAKRDEEVERGERATKRKKKARRKKRR
jgi:DNA primase